MSGLIIYDARVLELLMVTEDMKTITFQGRHC